MVTMSLDHKAIFLYYIPNTRTEFGKYAFSHAAPYSWIF